MSRPELSDDDLGTLDRAADLRRRFDAGIFPSTIGQRSHFAKLVRLGLLVLDGWGRDIDGEKENDVQIYKLTEAGEALADLKAFGQALGTVFGLLEES